MRDHTPQRNGTETYIYHKSFHLQLTNNHIKWVKSTQKRRITTYLKTHLQQTSFTGFSSRQKVNYSNRYDIVL